MSYAAKYVTSHKQEQAALRIINSLLGANGKSLQDYPPLPQIDDSAQINVNNLMLLQELSYDREALCVESNRLVSTLNHDQSFIFNCVMEAVKSN